MRFACLMHCLAIRLLCPSQLGALAARSVSLRLASRANLLSGLVQLLITVSPSCSRLWRRCASTDRDRAVRQNLGMCTHHAHACAHPALANATVR